MANHVAILHHRNIYHINPQRLMNTAEKAMLKVYAQRAEEQSIRMTKALNEHPLDTLTVIDAAEFIQFYGKKIERVILKIDARNESHTSAEL